MERSHAATHLSLTLYGEIQSRTTHLMITMQVNCMGQEQTWCSDTTC